jgi:hypothetical protein
MADWLGLRSKVDNGGTSHSQGQRAFDALQAYRDRTAFQCAPNIFKTASIPNIRPLHLANQIEQLRIRLVVSVEVLEKEPYAPWPADCVLGRAGNCRAGVGSQRQQAGNAHQGADAERCKLSDTEGTKWHDETGQRRAMTTVGCL